MSYLAGKFDVIVLGAGHAGCEAALACARLGCSTLVLTLNMDAVALMPCNPAIGGTSKGHLVREVDALGGEMGLAADDTLIQSRMLNTAKGPAVHSLRAQMDKRRYHERMKRTLETQQGLTLRQGEAKRILTEGGRVSGIETTLGARFECRALIVAAGVYLKSRILIGDAAIPSGPSGLSGANQLSDSLLDLGIGLLRFKTGTPARVNALTVDFTKMAIQCGDEPIIPFSFMTRAINREQLPCYLAYTNAETHEIIKRNINKSAMFSGLVEGTGARYCPSIEDKIVRFADKERHQIFIEPEGAFTNEMYVQGMSTSLPEDVQLEMLRSIEGMERCEIMRPGYAIEYDCIDPTQLRLSLELRSASGLFMAGQINGSSGYEEAAAQGLMAGINAALHLKGEPPLVLKRSDGYIGVLIDDLVTKGTNEPYRMMTSRAEYRLLLRQDNADLRLTQKGRGVGLVGDERFARFERKHEELGRYSGLLNKTAPNTPQLAQLLTKLGQTPRAGLKWQELLKRDGISFADIYALNPEWPLPDNEIIEQLEIGAKYDGYIKSQFEQVERFHRLENMALPETLSYDIGALRIEARQKLERAKPANLGQASRISGVSPADIAVLLVYIEKMRREGAV